MMGMCRVFCLGIMLWVVSCAAKRDGELVMDGSVVKNFEMGHKKKQAIDMTLTFVNTPEIILSAPSTDYSGTAIKVPNTDTYWDYITIGKTHVLHSSYTLGAENQLSMGWFASKYDGCTWLGTRVLPGIVKKAALGVGVLITDTSPATFEVTMAVTAPLEEPVSISVLVQQNSSIIKLPLEWEVPDRTTNKCYTFVALEGMQVCTQTVVNGEYVIQAGTSNFLELGWKTPTLTLALTSTNVMEYRLHAGWDETIIYDNTTVGMLIGLLSSILIWNLVVSSHDARAQLTRRSGYGRYSLLFSSWCSILCASIVIYQWLVRDLGTRVQFLTNVDLTIYGPICMVALACIFFLFLVSTWYTEIGYLVRQSCLNTLLTAAMMTVIIGRSVLCEETVVLLVLSGIWITQQSVAIYMGRHDVRTLLLLLFIFVCCYGPITIIIIEPFIVNTPFFQPHAWVIAQLLIVVPIVLQVGYASIPAQLAAT